MVTLYFYFVWEFGRQFINIIGRLFHLDNPSLRLVIVSIKWLYYGTGPLI